VAATAVVAAAAAVGGCQQGKLDMRSR
jgi:hypothetical protein